MNEKELQDQIDQIVGIDPVTLSGDSSRWTVMYTDELAKFEVSSPSKNPPADPLADLLTANLTSHYIIDRISRQELVDRLLKIWPEANGLDFSEFLDKLDRDKDAYWKKVRGEQELGK